MEYPLGAGIGWHRDALPFGIVAGISLGASRRMRFQRGEGAARTDWQHTIPPVKEMRWSITFRTVRRRQAHML